MNSLVLAGCRPEPIGSYLKALAVLRLVGEQKDAEAKGFWTGEAFHVVTYLDRAELSHFFLDDYTPTPLIAPWNSGSGFRRGGKRPQAERTLAMIESSAAARLEPYRDAIRAGWRVVQDAEKRGWRGRGEEFWDKKVKALVVELCRASFPDSALRWLDASVVLAEEPEFRVPLLGTGGNLGSQELSISFMQRLCEILGLLSGRRAPGRAESEGWLGKTLSAEGATPLVAESIGQFDPGAAGGVNTGESLVNPWDYVLMLEGAVLFASAAARRLGSGARGRAAMPFTFGASPVGYGSASSAEADRGSEIWAPLWSRPAMAREVAHLIGQGRAEWRGRQARTAVDVAKAAAALGVDRGVSTFVRHVIVQRFGQSPLVVPVGRVDVRTKQEVPVLATLDSWTDTARRGKNPPAAVASALRRLDAAAFNLAVRGGSRRLQGVLIAAAEAEEAIGRARAFRVGPPRVPPLRGLSAGEWVPLLDDRSPEFRLAAALASQRDDDGSCLRLMLRPVTMSQNRRIEWSEGPPPVTGLGTRPITDVLASVLVRRIVEAAQRAKRMRRSEAVPDGTSSSPGIQPAYPRRIPAPIGDVASFVNGHLDEARFGTLLSALMLLDWSAPVDVRTWFDPQEVGHLPNPAWALLAPFFHGRPIRLQDGDIHLRPEAPWPSQLAASRVEPVVRAALLRLRMAHLEPAPRDSVAIARGSAPGPRLAAAMLCPLSRPAAESLLLRIVPRPLE